MAKSIPEQIDTIIKRKRDKSLVYSIKDGAGHSAMVGFGENYISAFAIALQATNSQIAFLSSIPQLLASGFQLLSASLIGKLRGRKTIIITASLLQAMMFLPILATPFLFDSKAAVALIVFVSLYHIFGHFIAPAWNSLMGDLVHPDQRGEYFGKRSKVIGLATFLSFVAAGLILKSFPGNEVFIGFVLTFGLALVARLYSTFYLARMYDPPYTHVEKTRLSFMEFVAKLPYNSFGKFTLYLFLINFAVHISNPFFVVYMFRTLGFSYLEFMIATAVNIIVTFTTMLYWGRHADQFGNKKILQITGYLITINPLLWLLPFGFWWIMIVQMWTGFVWAGFHISSSNYLFDQTEPSMRAKTIAYYNFFIGIAIFFGALTGGFLATYVFVSPWIFLSNLQFLFLVSGSIRLVASWRFIPMLKEVRDVKRILPDEKLFIDLVAVKPMQKIAAEAIMSLDNARKIGERSMDISMKVIEEGKKIMSPNITRVTEIDDVLREVIKKSKKVKGKDIGYRKKHFKK